MLDATLIKSNQICLKVQLDEFNFIEFEHSNKPNAIFFASLLSEKALNLMVDLSAA